MSTDHDWGPRVTLFLRVTDVSSTDAITMLFRQELPRYFYGFPVSITTTDREDDPAQSANGVPDHRVQITTVSAFVWYALTPGVNEKNGDKMAAECRIERSLPSRTQKREWLGKRR